MHCHSPTPFRRSKSGNMRFQLPTCVMWEKQGWVIVVRSCKHTYHIHLHIHTSCSDIGVFMSEFWWIHEVWWWRLTFAFWFGSLKVLTAQPNWQDLIKDKRCSLTVASKEFKESIAERKKCTYPDEHCISLHLVYRMFSWCLLTFHGLLVVAGCFSCWQLLTNSRLVRVLPMAGWTSWVKLYL